jgi:hypothetical protein
MSSFIEVIVLMLDTTTCVHIRRPCKHFLMNTPEKPRINQIKRCPFSGIFSFTVTYRRKQERGKKRRWSQRLFLLVRPAGRTHLGVEVPCGPDRGNR